MRRSPDRLHDALSYPLSRYLASLGVGGPDLQPFEGLLWPSQMHVHEDDATHNDDVASFFLPPGPCWVRVALLFL
jgi:hypothetical protein